MAESGYNGGGVNRKVSNKNESEVT